jgi:glycosyltransferase involved in cell wall biosynthesis
MPAISVLTPSFNYAWCIGDALESVAAARQHLPGGWEVEHVVVDDNSGDDSRELLDGWHGQITLELRNVNRGQSATLNRCLSHATGDWIAWLNADDFYLPWSLHDACVAFTDEVDLVYGDAAIVDRSARFLRLLPEHPFSLRTLRWWGPYLPVGAVFLRRNLIDLLKWREDLKLLLDWDLWLRAAENGARFRYVSAPYAATRFHDAQESLQSRPGRLAEKALVRKDHGLPSRPAAWRALGRAGSIDHGLRKAVNGGYAKQLRTRELKNRSMRWFDASKDLSAVASLYERGYGRRHQRHPPAGSVERSIP